LIADIVFRTFGLWRTTKSILLHPCVWHRGPSPVNDFLNAVFQWSDPTSAHGSTAFQEGFFDKSQGRDQTEPKLGIRNGNAMAGHSYRVVSTS
jgi:hypothetical protein